MGKENQKLRILFLQDIFNSRTDEKNVFNATQLCEILENEYDIKAERKAIYSDIEALKDYGLDIVNALSPKRGYYLKTRSFELAEVRLLTDAVLAAKFITPKKTKALIYKIGSLTSEFQEEELRRQVYVNSANKRTNEELYETISILSEAIEKSLQVQFDYLKRKIESNYVKADNARVFIVNPYALIWSNDYYYLVCNNPKYNNLMHVRLDRIRNIQITKRSSRHFSKVSKYQTHFDSADYANRLFNMFSGESGEIQLKCSNRIIDDIIERFGEDASLKTDTNQTFTLKANVELSEGLVSWLMQFGADVVVLSPAQLRAAVKEKAKLILKNYE